MQHPTTFDMFKGKFLCKFDQTQGKCEDINKITKQACKEGR
jgi:hypothetical protein